MTRNIVILLIIALIGGVYFWLSNNNEQDAKISDGTKPNSALVSVTLPEQLSDNAIIGKRIFEAKFQILRIRLFRRRFQTEKFDSRLGCLSLILS